MNAAQTCLPYRHQRNAPDQGAGTEYMRMRKILLIDDETELLQVLESGFRRAGFDVAQAANGLEGLERARADRPDLIVLDLRLPTLDGHTVCQLLKADQQYRHIPIIMLTASREQEDQEWAARTGADLYLTKPCRIRELIEAATRLLTPPETA